MIRMHGDGGDRSRLSGKRFHHLPIVRVKQSSNLVGTAGEDPRLIRTEGDRSHRFRMAIEIANWLTVVAIPDARGFVV